MIFFFACALKLSDHLFRTGADAVEQPGTIDKGYFYCAVWLKGKKIMIMNTCIILKGYLLVALCPTYTPDQRLYEGSAIVLVLNESLRYQSQFAKAK